MNLDFQCTKCKIKLNDLFLCPNCSKQYNNSDGFFDFTDSRLSFTYTQERKFSDFLSDINSHGYTKSLETFLKENPRFEHKFMKKEGDIAFGLNHRNHSRCLIINSDLGNIPENLSDIFDEVYSLELDKNRILIQKFRFEEHGIKNTVLFRAHVDSLPFSNNYFDLVVLNGIQISEKSDVSTRTQIINYFKEIKRVLTLNGCLCVGADNKSGIKIPGNEADYYTDNKIYSDSFKNYNSFFTHLGFNVKSCWALPSYNKPHYLGNIEDGVSLKWLFSNFDKFFATNMKIRSLAMFFKLFNKSTCKLVMKFIGPSFIFYCYSKETPQGFEDFIKEKTGFEHYIQSSRNNKVMHILLDESGDPKKILSCKRAKYDFTEKIMPIIRKFPKMKDVDEKILSEDWFGNDHLDRLNINHVKIALDWLTNFQNNTSSGSFDSHDIDAEVENLKSELDRIKEIHNLPYHKCLDEYKQHVSVIKLKKTAVHGDFQVRNILVNQDNSSVNVIDWGAFMEKGNPFIDFLALAGSMIFQGSDSVEECESNLRGTGKAVPALQLIKKTMNEHFQADLDFIILLRFRVLKILLRNFKTKRTTTDYFTYVELFRMLSERNG